MADDSWLDYIVTFLGKVHTAATVYSIQTVRDLNDIGDSSRMLVYPGEIIWIDHHYAMSRHLIKIYEESEPLLMTAVNNIAQGIWKLNTRQAITSYTRPAAFIHASMEGSNKPFVNADGFFWLDINLDCKFTTG